MTRHLSIRRIYHGMNGVCRPLRVGQTSSQTEPTEVTPHLIRDFRPDDLEGLVRMFQAGDNTPVESFRRALDAYSIMVAEARGRLKGFVGTREAEPGERDIRVYVDPAHRRRGVGRRLFEVGMERLKGSGRVTAKYRADAGGGGGGAAGGTGGAGNDGSDARAFYAGRGFRVWYGMDELIYRGGRRAGPPRPAPWQPGLAGSDPASAPALDIRPYDDRHFEAYVRLVGDTFEPMRRSHDFRPHNVCEMNSTPGRRDYFLAHRDDIFLAFESGSSGASEVGSPEEGVLVGEAAVEGDFIDEIGVAPGHQGQGYGRILTLFCLDLLLNRGHPHPRTSVVVANEPARGMYYRLGFELVQTNEWACRRSGSAGVSG